MTGILNAADIAAELKEMLAQAADVSEDKIGDATQLGSDLGLDSLSLAEFLYQVEDKYSIVTDELDLNSFITFSSISEAVARLVAEKQGAAPAE